MAAMLSWMYKDDLAFGSNSLPFPRCNHTEPGEEPEDGGNVVLVGSGELTQQLPDQEDPLLLPPSTLHLLPVYTQRRDVCYYYSLIFDQ